MAKQRKRGKGGYLQDFEKMQEGGYTYTGKTWKADPAMRRSCLAKLWVLQAVMLFSVVLPGFVTTAGLMNTFYVILPYVFWMISDVYLTYTLGRMTFGGNPLRNYVYERSAAQYASVVMIPFAGALLTAAGLLLFLLRAGEGDGAAVCFTCCAIQAAASLLGRKCRVIDLWKEV